MAPPAVTIVVLGDIGRSPRMQYHAQSFLKEGFLVNVIGYGGSKPNEYIISHKNCRIKYLSATPEWSERLPVLLKYLVKVVWQFVTVALALSVCARTQHLLVQTPPAIPTLLVCWLHSRLVGASFCVDWHNYAFSIFALKHGPRHFLVRLSEGVEGWVGRRADASLCVTKAMKRDLMDRWSIKAVVLYDRPPEHFGAVSADEREALMTKYSELSTLRLSDRPGLLVSSTSWTEDEDFSILLTALQEYDTSTDPSLPKLLCVITGKGPLKDFYMQKVAEWQWSRVKVVSLWLTAEDYPRLLASADLGVSLHSSSSGLDLPMKVVDMFGCGLPVAALHFPCLSELVRHGDNGLVFRDSGELCQQLVQWFKSSQSKQQFKKAIQEFQTLRWHDNWKTQAFPIFNRQ